jgi:hypothetical protein
VLLSPLPPPQAIRLSAPASARAAREKRCKGRLGGVKREEKGLKSESPGESVVDLQRGVQNITYSFAGFREAGNPGTSRCVDFAVSAVHGDVLSTVHRREFQPFPGIELAAREERQNQLRR